MCGICGALGVDSAFNIVRRMNQAMVHRGPDSDGFLDNGRIALGVRRLRIIDLKTGDQPIYSEDRQVAVVFNGEIYNFQALYQDLAALGHRFLTRSDTEVIVHAYEEWGIDCLPRLRGMFAFAIYDQRERPGVNTERVFLARDRLGIKPLYLWHDQERLLFASEVRALLASGAVPKVLSVAGLYTFLAFGSVQEPLTLVEDVYSLAPGSWLQIEIGAQDLEIQSGVYWRPPTRGKTDPGPSLVRHWLTDAVKSRLLSDVPLGAFLSGGLDSGAIVSLGSSTLNTPMRTFTLAFDNWPGDERDRAETTARRWHSDHQVRMISQDQVLADIPQAVSAMDQPTVDGINTWYVSREARQAGLTVALSGVGGDELFAGYASFHWVPRLKQAQRALRWLPGGTLLEDTLAKLPAGPLHSRRKLGALLAGQMFFNHPYFAVRSLFTPCQVRTLLHPYTVEKLHAQEAALELWHQHVENQIQVAASHDAVNATSWLELSQYMRSTLLRDSDAMSMAHSLEVRVPFVDHLLVERILPVQGRRKLGGRQPKPLLVNTLEDLLSHEIATGEKQTFTFPFEKWLRQDLAQIVDRALEDSDGLSPWLDVSAARQVWSQFNQGHTNWPRPWALFVLAQWVKNNL